LYLFTGLSNFAAQVCLAVFVNPAKQNQVPGCGFSCFLPACFPLQLRLESIFRPVIVVAF